MENTQWPELLRPFNAVKRLYLYGKVALRVVPALKELTGQTVTDVLPVLRNLFLLLPEPSEPVQEAIGQFVAARRLSGHPVTVHRW